MARVTHVKKAQQRYETSPVIDPETGEQKRTPVMGRNGEQKVSKRGPVFLRVTEVQVNPDWVDEAKDVLREAIDGCEI